MFRIKKLWNPFKNLLIYCLYISLYLFLFIWFLFLFLFLKYYDYFSAPIMWVWIVVNVKTTYQINKRQPCVVCGICTDLSQAEADTRMYNDVPMSCVCSSIGSLIKQRKSFKWLWPLNFFGMLGVSFPFHCICRTTAHLNAILLVIVRLTQSLSVYECLCLCMYVYIWCVSISFCLSIYSLWCQRRWRWWRRWRWRRRRQRSQRLRPIYR